MPGYRKRKRISLDDYDGDVVVDQTPNHKAYLHFTHSPSGLRNTDGLPHAYEQQYGIYRKKGNSVYVAGTKRFRDVYDD